MEDILENNTYYEANKDICKRNWNNKIFGQMFLLFLKAELVSRSSTS